MILYLLFPALILGFVELQPANITEELWMNQTFSVSTNDNSSVKSNNVTSSLYQDEKTRTVGDAPQSNRTSDLITEDNEKFQEQENMYSVRRCNLTLLELSYHWCSDMFHKEMPRISSDHWCILEKVIGPYNELTICMEYFTHEFCYFPNTLSQEFFLNIHSTYFHNCTNSELLLEDAPHGVVIALTLIPVSFIPLLVYLVVWKSNVQTQSG